MKLVREYIEFTKGKDPKKTMGIGRHYEIWRENHNNKPVVRADILMKDPSGQDYTYSVNMMYGSEENWKDSTKMMDSIWFADESLYQNNRNLLMTLPYPYFPTEEEKTHWGNPEVFNREIIDPMEENPEKSFDEFVSELFENPWKKTAEYITEEFLKRTDIDTGSPNDGFILEDIQYQYFT